METPPPKEHTLTDEEKKAKLELVARLEAKIAEIEAARDHLKAIKDSKDAAAIAAASDILRARLAEGKALQRKLEGDTTESVMTVSYERTHEDGTKEIIPINLDFEKILTEFTAFYAKHALPLPPDFDSLMRSVWEHNYEAIQKAIEEKGFDTLLLIPGGTTLTDLHTRMTEGYYPTLEHTPLASITESPPAPHLLLLHNAQELDPIPELKQTLGKSARQFLSLPAPETLTLSDYLVFQRKFFEDSKGQHPDTKHWTWLPGSLSGARVVAAGWGPAIGRLYVNAGDPDRSYSPLGCRLSRSFL